MFDFQGMNFETGAETNYCGLYIPPASECMRCGMCVSVCPTFKLFQIDQETPRRRLRTISKLLVEEKPISDEERHHLDNCLQCRACEPACPSHVAYGQLFDQAQEKLQTSLPWLAKIAFWMIEHKHWRARLMPLLTLYLKTGLQKPLRKSGLLKKLGLADAEALLGQPALKPLNSLYPTRAVRRGAVALFTGCIAEQFDRETLIASIKLLNAIGFDVLVPPQQGCCGAIHQHNGQSAADLIANNLRVFNALDVEAVIHTATGCGVMLTEYQAEDTLSTQQFGQRLADINSFLLQHWPDSLKLDSARLSVVVHEPCSQRNVLKNQQAVYALLEKIPDMSLMSLANNTICCGAGGSYMLTHPENAGQLRALKHQAITQAKADRVVSSNFGCAVFLSANADKIVHPIVLLAEQLPPSA